MAAACLFLAAKVEEQPRKLEHVIKVAHMCHNRDQGPLDIKSEVSAISLHPSLGFILLKFTNSTISP